MSETAQEVTQELVERLDEVEEENAQRAGEFAIQLSEQVDEDVVDIDTIEVAENMYQYLKFDLEVSDARNTIINNIADENGVEYSDVLDESALDSSIPELSLEEVQEVAEEFEDEDDSEFVTIEATVDRLWNKDNQKIAQSGLLRDDTEMLAFVSWETSELPSLVDGGTYRLEGVAVDEFQGDAQLKLNSMTDISILEDKEFESLSTTLEFSGMLVDIQNGSGLIERCTQDGCSRVLDSGTCVEHGDVDGEFDLRIKGVLDNGEETQDVVIGRELTEQITGVVLEEAREIAMNDFSNPTPFLDEIEPDIMMRHYQVDGWVNDEVNQLIAEDIEQYNPQTDISELTNRLESLSISSSEQNQLIEGDAQ